MSINKKNVRPGAGRIYFIYSLVFRGTDKCYIGCSMNLNARYSSHLSSRDWKTLGYYPDSIQVLEIARDSIHAGELEVYWIDKTWANNLNINRLPYHCHD